MKTETVKQINELLFSHGYRMKTLEEDVHYLLPNLNDLVQIAFDNGLFDLKLPGEYFSAHQADAVIEAIEKKKPLVLALNHLLEESGDKKEAILKWQEKIHNVGMSLNVNGSNKFWNFVQSYGLFTQRNGLPEFSELWLWNEDLMTFLLFIDEETSEFRISFGLRDEHGEWIQEIKPETVHTALQIVQGSEHEFIFQLEDGLGLRLWIKQEQAQRIHHEFIAL